MAMFYNHKIYEDSEYYYNGNTYRVVVTSNDDLSNPADFYDMSVPEYVEEIKRINEGDLLWVEVTAHVFFEDVLIQQETVSGVVAERYSDLTPDENSDVDNLVNEALARAEEKLIKIATKFKK